MTATVRPNSGRDSSQEISDRSAATSPTSVIAGARMPAASSAIESSVETTVFCPGSVPRSITATGVDADRPPAMRLDAIRGSAFTPM